MSTVSIRRRHQLTPKQAVSVAKKVAAELAKEYGIVATWIAADQVEVEGRGLTGTLKLAPNLFKLDIKLGFLQGMFADRIRDGVEDRLDELLAAKTPKRK